jgi:superfamily II DNA/RNA helicase
MSFAQLGLSAPVLEGVKAMGYTDPTPIQLRAIPLILEGRDVIGSAQTGTGKTAAFALPLACSFWSPPVSWPPKWRPPCAITAASPI